MQGTLSPNPHLAVRDTGTPKGRGVFARQGFLAGTVVETSPILAVPTAWDALPGYLQSMVYDWGYLLGREANMEFALALGPGSLLNHAARPNLAFAADDARRALVFTALRDIDVGEELTIDYDADAARDEAGAPSPGWFEALGIPRLE